MNAYTQTIFNGRLFMHAINSRFEIIACDSLKSSTMLLFEKKLSMKKEMNVFEKE